MHLLPSLWSSQSSPVTCSHAWHSDRSPVHSRRAAPPPPLPLLQGGRVEVGAPTGRWQMVVVYRGKHDPLDITYLAALQVGEGGAGRGGEECCGRRGQGEGGRGMGAGRGRGGWVRGGGGLAGWRAAEHAPPANSLGCAALYSLQNHAPGLHPHGSLSQSPSPPPSPLFAQHLMPEFEEMNVDVVAVSADTRGRACSFVSLGGMAGLPSVVWWHKGVACTDFCTLPAVEIVQITRWLTLPAFSWRWISAPGTAP